MKGKSDVLLGYNGSKLYYRYWEPKNTNHVLAIIHGLGEHSGRYANMANYFGENEVAVFALDLRGHGKSTGKRGHTPSYQALMVDIEEFLKTIRAQHNDLPICLFGHSMGGNLVANYVLKMNVQEIDRYALSAPYFRLAFTPPSWKVSLARIMSKIAPSLTQPNGLNTSHLSKIQSVIDSYLNDPLVHNKISTKLFVEITNAGEFALNTPNQITIPGFVYHGGADHIIDPRASEEFASRQSLASWKLYPEAYHEPHNDKEEITVHKNLLEWIKK